MIRSFRVPVEMNADIDKRTVGYKRRQESMMKSLQALLDLLQQALAAGVQASYLLFDSWFSFPSTIMSILKQGMHVICMLKAMPKVYYAYNGAKFNLNALYKEVRKNVEKLKS